MTNEEAIYCIKVNICYKQEPCNDGICKSTEDRPCAIDVAIDALEKQIPKKPKEAKPPMSKVNVRCPNCENTFTAVEVVGKVKHCHECGQRIDFSEVE